MLRGLARSGFIVILLTVVSGGMAQSDGQRDATRIRVVTYNVQFLPPPAHLHNERARPAYRARRIAQEMGQFDIVALQETFHETYRAQIVDGLRATWHDEFWFTASPKTDGFHTSGGCLLMSRLPVLATSSMVFENFSSPQQYGLRADGFAAKGVIHGRIARRRDEDDAFIDLFVTHLEARADHLRPLQFDELAEFIRSASDPKRPMLLLGDLNTKGRPELQHDPDSQYSQLMQRLADVRPGGVVDLWPHLRGAELGGTTEQESADIGKRIDYIILGNPVADGAKLRATSIEVRLYQDPQVEALSDHNAVVATLEWEP